MKKTILFLSFLIYIVNLSHTQTQNFDVVFTADYWTISDNHGYNGSKWLHDIKTYWGATSVCLYVNWIDVENTEGNFSWWAVDSYVQKIIDSGLTVSIRLPAAVYMPNWVEPSGGIFNEQDFQILNDGTMCYQYEKPSLNFASGVSKYYMLRYFRTVIEHLRNTFGDNIIEIVPSVMQDSEMEYPHTGMCGYSDIEISLFRQFLQDRYVNISSLNTNWGSNFGSFENIDPKDGSYNWHLLAPQNYVYPSGRVDWMEFRTKTLKNFIDECASIIHENGYKMGLQIGSLYDWLIEIRGWTDPTSLLENVDALRHDDILYYKPVFEFAADYSRSICNYWTNQNSRLHTFSTELTWPDFPRQGDPPIIYPSEVLDSHYTIQLQKFYERGAQAVYLTQWDRFDIEKLVLKFPNLQNKLLNLSNGNVQIINHGKSVHLSCEQANFTGNPSFDIPGLPNLFNYNEFELYKSITPRSPYGNNGNNYDKNCDITTNYMIMNSYNYISGYTNFYFTKSSKFISDIVYYNLMKANIQSIPMENATLWNNNGHYEFAYTQGLKNEYNDTRSPIHLIWRTRPDLQLIWPDASLPDPSSGWIEDFIYWAKNYGSENASNPEYPGWVVYTSLEPSLYIYDKNIKQVWDERYDLQYYYCDAHYRCNGSVAPNMIEWAKCCGYLESPLLSNYFIWPYIGGIDFHDGFKKNIINNQSLSFSLGQNYPNPFNPKTKISYEIPIQCLVIMKIYDILGREIKTIVNEVNEAGKHEVVFDASSLASGIYFYKIEVGRFRNVKKMVVLK